VEITAAPTLLIDLLAQSGIDIRELSAWGRMMAA
jgi:hypothetical protein